MFKKLLQGIDEDGIGPALDRPMPRRDAHVNDVYKEILGFTISPPLTGVPYDTHAYIFLSPLRYIIENYECYVYGEFSNEGRLHYHGYCYVDDTNYSIVYKTLSLLKEHFKRDKFKILQKSKDGKSERVYLRSFKRIAQIKPELIISDAVKWKQYCSKGTEQAQRLMGVLCVVPRTFFKSFETHRKYRVVEL